MTARTSAQAFAEAAAAMVNEAHVGDTLGTLLADCAEVLGAQAVAILVTDAQGRLDLLASTSSVADQLEMLQAQDQHGPCVDAVRTGKAVSVRGAQGLVERWGHVGTAIVQCGFEAVDSFPLVWHGRPLGGLNVFRDEERRDVRPDPALTQAFADVATIVLLNSIEVPAETITARVHEAVMARSVVEQAKGVLAETEDVDLETASRLLRELAGRQGRPVTDVAVAVVESAFRGV